MKKDKVYAFIDGNNLYLGAKAQGITIHYGDFRLYLRNKLGAEKVFLFIGYDPRNATLYKMLQRYGYILVFKPTIPYVEDGARTMKGNVDAELVLHCAAIEYPDFDKAVIVTSDGDFACLVQYLVERGKLAKIITPTEFHSSLFQPYTSYILPISRIKAKISRINKKKK
ncbi:NYN domain-containing protein [Candidatus Saccharibacteria bacterium]|nr:NYN domain-containing protein [Candidatus Saccharibacteria bacterium]